MIDDNRPICVVIPIDFDDYKHRELRADLSETIDTEGFYDEAPGHIVESCCAEWAKEQLDEAGNVVKETCGITKIEFTVRHYVKCMEPALFYMHIPHAYGSKSFCGFHKPQVRPM